jgi:hypothetical protein
MIGIGFVGYPFEGRKARAASFGKPGFPKRWQWFQFAGMSGSSNDRITSLFRSRTGGSCAGNEQENLFPG